MARTNKKIKGYPCLCCGYLTHGDPQPAGHYLICPVCFWEDDPVQADDPDFDGGANDPSLNQARENFKKFGAADLENIRHIRKPLPKEIPWQRAVMESRLWRSIFGMTNASRY